MHVTAEDVRQLPAAALRFARRRWADLTALTLVLAAAWCLAMLAREVYANSSGESAAPGQPPGFYLGQLQTGSAWDGDRVVPYGLYRPPEFRRGNGPHPLIVFVPPAEQRSPKRVFSAGLPKVIASKLGAHRGGSGFGFAALFLADGPGVLDGAEVGRVVDYVTRRHDLDPGRVYLTGYSDGADAAYALARSLPGRFAALAPVSAYDPGGGAPAVGLPVWAFRGAKDSPHTVAADREFVASLRKVGADVIYTEYPDAGHNIWSAAYGDLRLYEWFAAHHK